MPIQDLSGKVSSPTIGRLSTLTVGETRKLRISTSSPLNLKVIPYSSLIPVSLPDTELGSITLLNLDRFSVAKSNIGSPYSLLILPKGRVSDLWYKPAAINSANIAIGIPINSIGNPLLISAFSIEDNAGVFDCD